MRVPRVLTAQPLATGAEIALEQAPAHHLARVLRMQAGDAVQAFNGEGGEYAARIARVERDRVWLTIGEYLARDVESPLVVELAQGISRGERMDYTLQKAVELGVSAIHPIVTARGVVKLDGERADKRLQHWQSVVDSACEQSGRNRVPRVHAQQNFVAWLKNLRGEQTRLTLSPTGARRLRDLELDVLKPVVLLIGPEGGLSDAEIESAHTHGFVAVSLGPRILRTETAGLAALAALQTRWGDL